MRYELKTWPESFEATWMGEKLAEIRVDDRGGYKAGDVFVLREWIPKRFVYTGRRITATVSHVVRGPRFGVPENYAMCSIVVTSRERGAESTD